MERDFLISNRISATDIFKVAMLRKQADKSQKNIAILKAILKRPCLSKTKLQIKKILAAEEVFLKASRQSLAKMENKPEFISSPAGRYLKDLSSSDLGTGKMRKDI